MQALRLIQPVAMVSEGYDDRRNNVEQEQPCDTMGPAIIGAKAETSATRTATSQAIVCTSAQMSKICSCSSQGDVGGRFEEWKCIWSLLVFSSRRSGSRDVSAPERLMPQSRCACTDAPAAPAAKSHESTRRDDLSNYQKLKQSWLPILYHSVPFTRLLLLYLPRLSRWLSHSRLS